MGTYTEYLIAYSHKDLFFPLKNENDQRFHLFWRNLSDRGFEPFRVTTRFPMSVIRSKSRGHRCQLQGIIIWYVFWSFNIIFNVCD